MHKQFEVTRRYEKRATKKNPWEAFFGVVTTELVIDDEGNIQMLLNDNVLPRRSVEYMLKYAGRSLQDAYAGAEDEDEAQAAFDQRMDAIVKGTIGLRDGTSVSAFHKRVRTLALQTIKRKIGDDQFKTTWVERLKSDDAATAENALEQLDAFIAKNPSLAESVQKMIDAEKATRDALIDDDSLVMPEDIS